eukprot:158659_1
MDCPGFDLKDKTNNGWGFEQDYTEWDNKTMIQWIGILDENESFVDKYEDIFKLQNINGMEHFSKQKLGNSEWCKHLLGMDYDTADTFSFIIRQRIRKSNFTPKKSNEEKSNEEKYEEESEEKHDLQVALTNYECKCTDSNTQNGDILYVCKDKRCSMEIFCEDCGAYYHNRKKSKKGHLFNIGSKNVVVFGNLSHSPADIDKVNCGEKVIISIIGNEQYKQIKPILEKGVVLVGSNFPMCATLGFELHQFFHAASLAVTKANEASKAYEALKVAMQFDKNKSYFWNMLTYMMRTLSIEKWDELRKAEKHYELTKLAAEQTLKNPLPMKKILKAGVSGMVIATAIEISVHGYRCFKGDISVREWIRLSGKTVLKNLAVLGGSSVGGYAGAWVGCKLGAWAGTTISPGVGTGIGASIGIVTGILMGYLSGKTTEYIYNYFLPSNEDLAKQKLIEEALVYFHFQEKDVDNINVFNEKALKKKFRQFALDAHPDRRGGDHEEWHRLSTNYGILKALVEQNGQNKKLVTRMMKKETQKVQLRV